MDNFNEGSAVQEFEEHEKKERVVLGILGALIGALIGCAVILLIGHFGYIASIGGVIMAICSVNGYRIFAGKMSNKGVFFCIVIMAVTVYFANRLEYALDFYKELDAAYGDISFIKVYENLNELLWDYDVYHSYITDMICLYAFTGGGAFPTIKRNYKEADLGEFKSSASDDAETETSETEISETDTSTSEKSESETSYC